MESILLYIESFVNQLPPLLQMLLGVFVTLGMMKIIFTMVNYFEKKDSKE